VQLQALYAVTLWQESLGVSELARQRSVDRPGTGVSRAESACQWAMMIRVISLSASLKLSKIYNFQRLRAAEV
jgi:hypothetical protein